MGNDSHLLNMSLPVKSPKRTSLDCNHSDKLNGKSLIAVQGPLKI